MKTLYDLTVEAESKVGIYKNPCIREWITAIDPVLAAAGEPTIDTDTVDSLYILDTCIEITTSYICRGCACTSEITLPIDIIKADDPIKSATKYKIARQISYASDKLIDAKTNVAAFEVTIAKLNVELLDMM